MRKLVLLLATGLVLLAGLGVVLTASYVSTRLPVSPAPEIAVPPGAADRLAGAIRIPTISAEDPAAFDAEAFQRFRVYLQAAFPLVHSRLQREIVGTHSLLYTWQGTDASANPILLLGHMDVVPVEPGTENRWTQDPFCGRIVDGFIWGRGAIDD
jgi:carboxypeptidase PM20D1